MEAHPSSFPLPNNGALPLLQVQPFSWVPRLCGDSLRGQGALCHGLGSGCHSRGNPGGDLDLQEKQGAIAGEGERRRGGPP